LAPSVPARRDDEHDQQDQRPERDVEDRIDTMLGRTRRTGSGQGEHEQQATGDARDVRSEQVAGQQPFWLLQRQHDRRSGQQRRVQRGGQRKDEDLTRELFSCRDVTGTAPTPFAATSWLVI
jgi:hypothetical protein